MKKVLIVTDMQNDFVDGCLGTKEAVAIIPAVVKKIMDFNGSIIATFDTHGEDYMNTREGKHLPVPHCIKGTGGWKLNPEVQKALDKKGYIAVEKTSFGSTDLPELLKKEARGEELSVELIGLCTDICVVSNAFIVKAFFPEIEVSVDPECCAGVTPETHEAALLTMKTCQINIG